MGANAPSLGPLKMALGGVEGAQLPYSSRASSIGIASKKVEADASSLGPLKMALGVVEGAQLPYSSRASFSLSSD